MKSFIILRSSTAAQKAAAVLKRAGINADIGRQRGAGGCTHGIYTDSDADKVCRILSFSGIECIGIKGGGRRHGVL